MDQPQLRKRVDLVTMILFNLVKKPKYVPKDLHRWDLNKIQSHNQK